MFSSLVNNLDLAVLEPTRASKDGLETHLYHFELVNCSSLVGCVLSTCAVSQDTGKTGEMGDFLTI